MATKLCKDCVHCRPETIGGQEFHQCGRPVGISDVDGKPKRHQFKYCSVQRDSSMLCPMTYVFGMCGRRGRFFQPK